MNRFKPEVDRLVEQLVHDDEAVKRWLKKSKMIDSMERLPGDASTRRYYRIHTDGKSLILMKTDPFEKNATKYPFPIIQKHLKDCGVDVPEIYDIDPKRGYLLLEDLGDATLLHQLKTVTDTELERHIYQKVIDGLIQLQHFGSPQKGKPKIDAFKVNFDVDKLMWEVKFTVENFYDLHLNRKMKPKDRKLILNSFLEICKTLAKEPRVFTHRDFHSRNVMVLPKASVRENKKGIVDPLQSRFVMIDFQDARMGPKQYDLVSLLKDSYYQLDEAQVRRLTEYYIARWEAVADEKIDKKHFLEIFDLMAVQRNFKAIGSFASFYAKRGNSTYLKYIGNTFENIRRALLRQSQYSELREVLFHYYYF